MSTKSTNKVLGRTDSHGNQFITNQASIFDLFNRMKDLNILSPNSVYLNMLGNIEGKQKDEDGHYWLTEQQVDTFEKAIARVETTQDLGMQLLAKLGK